MNISGFAKPYIKISKVFYFTGHISMRSERQKVCSIVNLYVNRMREKYTQEDNVEHIDNSSSYSDVPINPDK